MSSLHAHGCGGSRIDALPRCPPNHFRRLKRCVCVCGGEVLLIRTKELKNYLPRGKDSSLFFYSNTHRCVSKAMKALALFSRSCNCSYRSDANYSSSVATARETHRRTTSSTCNLRDKRRINASHTDAVEELEEPNYRGIRGN